MDGSFLEEKLSFKMLGLTLSSKLDLGSYIISFAETASEKIRALICNSMPHSGCSALHGVNPNLKNVVARKSYVVVPLKYFLWC